MWKNSFFPTFVSSMDMKVKFALANYGKVFILLVLLRILITILPLLQQKGHFMAQQSAYSSLVLLKSLAKKDLSFLMMVHLTVTQNYQNHLH